MKKIIYLAVTAVTVLFTGCESFLNTDNITQKNTSNYPQTYSDAQQVVAGVYNNLSVVNANPQYSFWYVANLASDDRFGGGGANDKLMQAEDLLLNYNTDMFNQFWKDRYAGVFRASNAIETLGNCSGYSSDDQKNQMIGEAYFLRGFYYYELASLFENIPLFTTSAAQSANAPQATPAATWSQILADLKKAVELMPAKTFGSNWVEAGHVDHWSAIAMLGRAYLFYTGFYGVTDGNVTLPDGTTLTKKNVSDLIDDCVTKSGYSLVPDYRNLWAYTNRLTKEDYSYTKGQSLKWVEDDNAINPESMFAIKYSEFASWSTTIGYSNGYALHFGMRGDQKPTGFKTYEATFPFGLGWGAGPVSPGLWNDWASAEPSDMRRVASICNIPTELPNYTKGGWADYVQETDYYGKKLSPITNKNSDGTYSPAFDVNMYNYTAQATNMQLCNIHDLVLIRFADVLLMQSELEQNVDGINQVRIRAGLPTIAQYSDEALRNERRWEFNCEGIRWNDMRRYGATYAKAALSAQTNQPVYYKGVADVNATANNGGGYAARYAATNGGFFPIPESQISLAGGVLKQNTGWGTTAAEYTGWK